MKLQWTNGPLASVLMVDGFARFQTMKDMNGNFSLFKVDDETPKKIATLPNEDLARMAANRLAGQRDLLETMETLAVNCFFFTIIPSVRDSGWEVRITQRPFPTNPVFHTDIAPTINEIADTLHNLVIVNYPDSLYAKTVK